ncbi:MAG: family 16 glycoside hydrolase [Candidatus Hermodarchaeota archaeon]
MKDLKSSDPLYRWWNSSYKYRTPININNNDSSPIPKGYSINISVNTINFISTGRLRTDGKDLRVLWYNSSNDSWLELDRINETKFNSVDTQIWFKTQTSIDPGKNDNNYFLYYGYEDANDPPSNKNNVFDFYDDFTQPDGLAEGWTQTMGSSWSVVNNEYRENEGVNNRRTIVNLYTVENASIDIRLKSSGGTNICLGVMFRYLDSNNLYVAVLGGWQSEVGFGKWVNGNLQKIATTNTSNNLLVYDRWYDLKLELLGSQYLIYLDGTLKINTTDIEHLNAGQVGLITWTTSSTSYFDDLKIKLLLAITPSVTLGMEETQPILNNWWDLSYKFRTPIRIINRDVIPLPKGYSINISVNTINFISTGRLRTDGKDLRVLWYNSSNDSWLELDRINETKFNSVDTQIWFKTQTSIDPGKNDNNYFLYYGYEDANDPPSNKNNVFDFYDDFTQPDGLAEGWTQTMGSSWSVVNNEYRENEGVNNRRTIVNSYSVGNFSIEIRLKNSGGTNFGLGVMFRYLDSNNLYAIALGAWQREVGFGKWVDGSLSAVATTNTNQSELVPDQWYNFRLDVLGSQYLIYLDGTLKINTTDTDHLSSGEFGLITYTTSTVSYFDDLKIKLLVSKVPSLILGIEETQRPQFNYITESADPLELGEIEILIVNITDLSGIQQTIIEIDDIIYTMDYIGGDLWQFDSWIPLKTGYHNYKIFCQNNNLKWNSITESINVIDTTSPSYSNLIENTDPLELGSTEIISIEIFDISGINQVLIELEGINYTMINIGGDTWQYDAWTPSSTGTYPYTIYMEDLENNWNSVSDSIEVVDTTPPSYSNLVESADPLELGATEIIKIDILDLSGINQVLIELEGINYTMVNIGGDTWQYDAWSPSTTGTYSYTIYMEDLDNNWNSVSESIEVEDTTPPSYSNLIESADPLEIGTTEIIKIDILDLSGINQVLIEIEGINYTMVNIGGDTYQHDTWTPSSTGTYPYTIYMEDMNANWNLITDSLTVIDNAPPSYSDLIESADPLELGSTEIISINVYDSIGINQVLIEIEGINYTMVNIGGDTWQYDGWTPLSTGTYPYTIFMEDLDNNWNSVSESIEVVDSTPPSYSDLVESADSLELGLTEIISINVYDVSGINQVLIEIEGINYTMANIGGNTYQHDTWTPSSTGTYPYTIYMEDMNNNWNSVSNSITVTDTIPPEINIYEPNPYDRFGINPPEIIIEFIDFDLDAVWYQLTDGSLSGNYTWLGNIDENVWELFGTGLIIINFFAYDSSGNLGSASIIVNKDITAPDITINYPNPYDIFGKLAPNVNIEIEAQDLDTIWYKLFNSTQSITDYSWTGSIEQFIWDEFNSGILTIRFYANDTLGNIRFLDITIIKDVTPPVLIFYEPNPYNLYGASPPSIDIYISDDNLESVWYQL